MQYLYQENRKKEKKIFVKLHSKIPIFLKIELERTYLEGEYLFWLTIHQTSQIANRNPSNISTFGFLGFQFPFLNFTDEDKSHPWKPSSQLLLTAKALESKSSVVGNGMHLRTDIGCKFNDIQSGFFLDLPS